MKNDGNRSTKPSLIRAPPHPDDVAEHHAAKVDVTEPHDAAAHLRPARIDEVPCSVGYVHRDPDHQRQHSDLTEEQHRIWKKTRLPLFHRRQPPRGAQHDDKLSDDAEHEQGREEPEEKYRGHLRDPIVSEMARRGWSWFSPRFVVRWL